MARGDQLARQWMIMQELLVSRYGKTAAQLADLIECHPRTMYRDLDALVNAGFPIYIEKVDGKNLWSLLDTMKHSIPIPFTLPELMALHFSRDIMQVFKNTAFYDSLESLFQKVQKTLPKDSRTFIEKMNKTLHVNLKPHKEYSIYKEIINQVTEAARNKTTVEIVYFTMSRKKENKRKVDPYCVWFWNGTFYLIGHCHERKEVRMFVLGRIKLLHQTKEMFDVPDDFDLNTFLGGSFGVFQGGIQKVRVWFAPSVAGYIEEKKWHESQLLTQQDDGSVIMEVNVAGTEEIKYWIRSWGHNAEVLEPESLRFEMIEEAEKLLGRYQNNTQKGEQKVS